MAVQIPVPVHPRDDHRVKEARRILQEARTALTDIEARTRELERDRESNDALQEVIAARELESMRDRFLTSKEAVLKTQRAYDLAFETAQAPWREYWHAQYREVALRFFAFLEQEAVPMNQEMLAIQKAAAQAGVTVQSLHIPQLSREAVEHRIRIGRQGL